MIIRGLLSILFLLLASSTCLRAGEKAYLHLDNSAYFLGDTLRLSAYVMDTDSKRLTEKSKVLYVDLLAPEGYVIESRTYPLVNGRCAGDIYLRPLLLSGLLEIRAYTRYMQNEGQTNYYSQVVPVYEQVKNGQYQTLVFQSRKLRNVQKVKNDRGRKPLPWKSNYLPTLITCKPLVFETSYDSASMQPFQVTTVKVKGTPNAHLTLSITDADNYISINHENITDFVNGNISSVGENGKYFYKPEQELMVYGKTGEVIQKRVGQNSFRAIPYCQFNYKTMGALEENQGIDIASDSLGYFGIPIGKFVGNHFLLLKYKQVPQEGRDMFQINYDLDPPCKIYTKKEKQLCRSVLFGGKCVPVKTQKGKDKLQDVFNIDVLKETDRIFNNFSYWEPINRLDDLNHIDDDLLMQNDALVSYFLSDRNNYQYNLKTSRAIDLNGSYPGDTIVPETKDIDVAMDIRKYSEIVLRTDKAIRSHYDFSKGKLHDCYVPACGAQVHGFCLGAGSIQANDIEKGKPSLISCMVPDMNHEWDNYLRYNRIPGYRYLKVSGFSSLLPYRLPNYSKSHPEHDYRRTLYWNPDLQLDENGEATIQFYNNGTCKKLRISGEGVSDDGRAIIVRE